MKKRYTLTRIVFPDTRESVSFFVEILAIGITKLYTVTTVIASTDRNNVFVILPLLVISNVNVW
jgi:hypothetical protein